MLTIAERLIIECCSNQQERDIGERREDCLRGPCLILLHGEGWAATEMNLMQSSNSDFYNTIQIF